jgi:hypothetical protein
MIVFERLKTFKRDVAWPSPSPSPVFGPERERGDL